MPDADQTSNAQPLRVAPATDSSDTDNRDELTPGDDDLTDLAGPDDEQNAQPLRVDPPATDSSDDDINASLDRLAGEIVNAHSHYKSHAADAANRDNSSVCLSGLAGAT